MTYICPVCGYDKLEDPPRRYEICPSCGTEFGNDDYFNTHEELRQKWIVDGMNWWDDESYRPPNWSPVAQLKNIGVVVVDIKSDVFEIFQIKPLAVTSASYNPSVSTIRAIPQVAINPELSIKSTPIPVLA